MVPDGLAFIDADVFLGIHSSYDTIRVACKNLFVNRFDAGVCMTLEHVGKCDDVIWGYPAELQAQYFPFMDMLHTVMKVRRVAYSRGDMDRARTDPRLDAMDAFNALLLARVCNERSVLYTLNSSLLALPDLPVRQVSWGTEGKFPTELETAYEASLALRIPFSGPLPVSQ